MVKYIINRKKNESKHNMIKGNTVKSARSTYKQKFIKKFVSKSSQQKGYIKVNQKFLQKNIICIFFKNASHQNFFISAG